MHAIYKDAGFFIAGAVLSAMYYKSAAAYAKSELQKVRNELNALKSKIKL